MTVRIELIEEAHRNDVLAICQNLRDMDRLEIFATRDNDDPVQLASDVMDQLGFSWIAYSDDEPVAVMGASVVWPNHVAVFAFGTDKWQRVVFSLTKHGIRFMLPTFAGAGVKMAHVYVLSAYTQARGWLKIGGFIEQASIPGFGKGGEDFTLMTWRP